MEEFVLNKDPNIRTYSKFDRRSENKSHDVYEMEEDDVNDTPLSTREAVEFLLAGSLNSKVCAFCLHVSPGLVEMERLLTVGNKSGLYSIPVRDMVASFHPFQLNKDPNYPDKICSRCLDSTIKSYLFSQQCGQAKQAMKNCFEDILNKINSLDPLERPSKRGRQKLNPNHNQLHIEHEKVIDYAEPIINILGTTDHDPNSTELHEFECLKCGKVLPNLSSLINHAKTHPKTMCFNCRLCGKSFYKLYQIKKHLRQVHTHKTKTDVEKTIPFDCTKCGEDFANYHEFLQHMDKHTFKVVMKHLISNKMEKLCMLCFNKGTNMTSVNEVICLHGGVPEIVGERTVHSVITGAFPEISEQNYTGTKICENCYQHVLNMFLYSKHIHFVRNRLLATITAMVDALKTIKKSENNLCIEIPQSYVLPDLDPCNVTLFDANDDNQPIDILEDEFRIKSESENDDDEIIERNNGTISDKKVFKDDFQKYEDKNDLALVSQKLVNGHSKSKTSRIRKITKLSCIVCDKHFVSEYFLKRHTLKHTNCNVNCNICHIKLNSKFHLREHNKFAHVLQRYDYKTCKICHRIFLDENKFKSHEKRHSNKPCTICDCDKIFSTQSNLNTHLQRHSTVFRKIYRNRIKTCSFCEKECFNKNELSLHVNKVHLQIKPYQCDMCDVAFYSEQNLKHHRIVHSNYRRETCQFCNKTFKCRKNLVIHIRRHIGETPFSCSLCKQSFVSISRRTKHMKTHFV